MTRFAEHTFRRADDIEEVITIDHSRDALLTDFGKATLTDRYLLPGESYQDMFARVACAFADDVQHAQRVYDYISKLWFMPATPVLSNGGAPRGLPISCYLNSVPDSLEGIEGTYRENIYLASNGGGIGTYWGNVRGIGEKAGLNGKTSGIIPFVRVMDSLSLAISQGSLRRGSAAVYLDISHPEIEEFLEIRKPSGDFNRKSLNLHHGVLIPDAFMHAVRDNTDWELKSPKTGEVRGKVHARSLFEKLIETRMATGEPYIVFSDTVNRARPKHHVRLGLMVTTSNLCAEIMLPTGKDHRGNDRTAVCCLSSVNAEMFFEWSRDPLFVEDIMRFLANVLVDFVRKAKGTSMEKAAYAAEHERSVGLGVMGFHSFLQSMHVPFDSASADHWNDVIFKMLRERADAASRKLAIEKGPSPDWMDAHAMDPEAFPLEDAEYFTNKLATAPTASISIICGGTSAGIEPIPANIYNHKTFSGNFVVKNPYLVEVLEAMGHNTDAVWTSILENGGSVAHLDFLADETKTIFATAFEIPQSAVVRLSGGRAGYIDQGQSVNVFLPADCDKWEMFALHMQAWENGSKSLYYLRSKSVQRAAIAGAVDADNTLDKPAFVVAEDAAKYETCEACQ